MPVISEHLERDRRIPARHRAALSCLLTLFGTGLLLLLPPVAVWCGSVDFLVYTPRKLLPSSAVEVLELQRSCGFRTWDWGHHHRSGTCSCDETSYGPFHYVQYGPCR